MIAEGSKKLSPAYSVWIGKPVVLLVVIRRCHIPMPCSIVRESLAEVRVRISPGWEMDLRKELILAVEEDAGARGGNNGGAAVAGTQKKDFLPRTAN